MIKIIKPKIENLKCRAGKIMKQNALKEYFFDGFNINNAASSGTIKIDSNNKLAYSKWVTPKRTLSFHFARIYNT